MAGVLSANEISGVDTPITVRSGWHLPEDWKGWFLIGLFLAAAMYAGHLLNQQRTETSELSQRNVSPRGMVSLQLAGDAQLAETILADWRAQPSRLQTARDNVESDGRTIWAYLLAFLLGAAASYELSMRDERVAYVVGVIIVAAVAAAGADVIENSWLLRLLNQSTAPTEWQVTMMRAAAQFKFSFFSMASVATCVGLTASFRCLCLAHRVSGAQRSKFQELYQREVEALGSRAANPTTAVGPSGEPWVQRPLHEHVGIAFSGGGIRAATFSLGVLQGLDHFRLLNKVDYLSTVSGGGYIGAWWTAWRHRGLNNTASDLPGGQQNSTSTAAHVEANEVRHLREFSNFLAPRWGFFETEMWAGFVAVIAGMLPTIVVAVSLLTSAIVVFLFLLSYMAWPAGTASDVAGYIVLMTLTIGLFILEEVYWRRGQTDACVPGTTRSTIGSCLFALFFAALIWTCLSQALAQQTKFAFPVHDGSRWTQPEPAGSFTAWWKLIGIPTRVPATQTSSSVRVDVAWTEGTSAKPSRSASWKVDADRPIVRRWHFSPRIFEFGITWLLTGLVLAVPRAIFQSFAADWSRLAVVPAISRVAARLFGWGIVWLAAATLWEIACNLGELMGYWAAGGAASSAGLFALLRNWFSQSGTSDEAPGFTATLRSLLPQILAYAAVILTVLAVASSCIHVLADVWMKWFFCVSIMWLIMGLSLFLDPEEVSLHSFYRNRLSRAYLGASNASYPTVAENRHTGLEEGDDLIFGSVVRKPLHLICCTGNDLAGDQLSNLGRGSRSAVLSPMGLSIGESSAEQPYLRLATAMTASAAAFNSNMGSLSRSLGPAVSFLMSALNLRLGMWVRHPASRLRKPALFSGLLFVREMFQSTRCDLPSAGQHSKTDDVHLSDGGHFENLGLYELVRRHCRYIIVTDCGADPEAVFVDVGNAVRRIREDFGIEISLDVSPLKSGSDGLAKQHMAVGTIEYDRSADVGTLLIFKPNFTGDEPSDVQQYRQENPAFPQETTLDQFYSESQWEAYRRLGEHAARSALRFLEKRDVTVRNSIQSVFAALRQAWYPTPPNYEAKFLDFTNRCAELDDQVRAHAPDSLKAQLYPEWFAELGNRTPPPMSIDDHGHALHFLLQGAQLMEDVWLACDFDQYRNHPMNLGWMNYFHRWAYAPVFRMWWPVLRAIYSPGFRSFAEEHWKLAGFPVQPLVVTPNAIPNGFAARWVERAGLHFETTGKTVYSLNLTTRDSTPCGQQISLNVAFVVVKLDDVAAKASWRTDELFVPPSLWGTGIGSLFLEQLLASLRDHFRRCNRAQFECEVTLASPSRRTDLGSCQERIDMIDFYKSQKFELSRDNTPESNETMRLNRSTT